MKFEFKLNSFLLEFKKYKLDLESHFEKTKKRSKIVYLICAHNRHIWLIEYIIPIMLPLPQ